MFSIAMMITNAGKGFDGDNNSDNEFDTFEPQGKI